MVIIPNLEISFPQRLVNLSDVQFVV